MNIAMFTNTYLPHVGGVAESVRRFSEAYRDRGHRVLVVAPWFDGCHHDSPGVLRVPAWEHLMGSDFSMPLPVPSGLHADLHSFAPDVVHSHHPFLLGGTALRVAATENVPVVFTHHTQYDVYTHYLGGTTDFLRRLASEVATGYADLCDAVVAPSESIYDCLKTSGVASRIEVIPTGVDTARFASGYGKRFREEWRLPENAFVVGHVGRLAKEKNLQFLAEAVAEFLTQDSEAWFLVVGEGPLAGVIDAVCNAHGVDDRLTLCGLLNDGPLYDAYAAMDLFAFASQSETQGMVLAEAMAAGAPVVAVDAPGVREIVRDCENGRLLVRESCCDFVAAMRWVAECSTTVRRQLAAQARKTAEEFCIERTTTRALDLYRELIEERGDQPDARDVWQKLIRRAAQECRMGTNVVEAGAIAAFDGEELACSRA